MARELVAACERIDAEPSVGAVVVRGEGAYFCAGGDRATLAAARARSGRARVFTGLGDGLPLVPASRRAGAADDRRRPRRRGRRRHEPRDRDRPAGRRRGTRGWSRGFIPIGLHPGGGHSALLGRTGAREAAAAMALFGERIDGERAAEIGLAWQAVDDADVETRHSSSQPAGSRSRAGAADRELAAHRAGPAPRSRGQRRWSSSAPRRCGRCGARALPLMNEA